MKFIVAIFVWLALCTVYVEAQVQFAWADFMSDLGVE